MKKSKLMISTAVILSTVIVASAASYKQITAEVRPDIRLISISGTKNLKDKNGNNVNALVYNGKAYLPIDAMENLTGKEITWDEKNNAVFAPNSSDSQISQEGQKPTDIITQAKAEEIALNDAGFSHLTVTYLKTKHSVNENKYEVEFYGGSHKYEYDIDDVTGKIIGCEKKALSNSATPSNPNADIGRDKALAIALKDAGISSKDANHILVKYKKKNSVAAYEVEFWNKNTKYEYDINAQNGNIIKSETKIKNTASANEYISEETAKEIALKYANMSENSVQRLKVEFDVSNGKAYYEVEWHIGRIEYECKIDAVTGAVTKYKID